MLLIYRIIKLYIGIGKTIAINISQRGIHALVGIPPQSIAQAAAPEGTAGVTL
jgi:hypothetical protein